MEYPQAYGYLKGALKVLLVRAGVSDDLKKGIREDLDEAEKIKKGE